MNTSHMLHFATGIISACGSGDVEFLESWARAGDAFGNCLGVDGNGANALIHAVRGSHPECVLFMLQHVDANSATPGGYLPILEAAKHGNLRVLRILLDRGDDPNSNIAPALVRAAHVGFREGVLLLLERGADVNLKVRSTALSVAAANGHLEVMRDLFAAGADPNIVDQCGDSPLYTAISRRHPDAAELLLAWGADVTLTQIPAEGGRNALMVAAREGYAHLAAKILARAAEAEGEAFVNARATDGETALILACRKGSESVVRLLLEHPRIDVDVQDQRYHTALLEAVKNDHAGIAEALLARGASVKPHARAEISVLIHAIALGRRGLVKSILERGGGEDACVDFPGHFGTTALIWACRGNFLDVAEMLLQAGASVNALETSDWTALMHSVIVGAPEVSRMLLERGADPNLHRPNLPSPLVLACARSEPEFGEICRALIRAGADVHAKNSHGATALQVAIDNNNKEAVKALLNSGARVQADNAQRQLVDYIYELKGELEAVVQVFPHAFATASRGYARISGV